jgi:hypothetical protein
MLDREAGRLVVVAAACAAILYGLAQYVDYQTAAAQSLEREKKHVTRTWVIQYFERWSGTTRDIRVIDTTGVCLYVAPESDAIYAVPKTQLPAGAGCE